MDLREAFKWSMVYRGIATGAFLLGGILVVVGIYTGFGSAFSTLVEDPLNPQYALEEASPMLTIAFGLVGFVLWRIGKTYALFVTLPQAAGRSAAEEFDTERVKSELLEVLDDRLSEIHAEVEQTKRSVEALERDAAADEFATAELADDYGTDDPDERTTAYDESDSLQPPSTASARAESGSTSADSPGASAADGDSADTSDPKVGDSDGHRRSVPNGSDEPAATSAESDEPLE